MLKHGFHRFVFVLILSLLATVAAQADLDGDVGRIIKDQGLKGATVAVSIREADSDSTLVAINDRQPMIPASNMKLLTTGAALHGLGPDFAFETRLVLDSDRLVVIGDGDPGFGDPELLSLLEIGDKAGLTVDEFIDLWVEAIVRAGITEVDELLVDDRVFDREFVHDTWPIDQLNRQYCAEVSGLIFHLNLLHFYPRPLAGQRPDVTRFKPYGSWIDISTNRATSKSGTHDANTFSIARPKTSNNLTFFGNVKSVYSSPVPVTLHNGPEFFAHLLADRLRGAGVEVGSFGVVPTTAPATEGEPVAPTVRTPISTVVTRCNRDSQNLYAEALIKRLGHMLTSGTQQGSWANGGAAVRLIVNERLEDRSLVVPLIVEEGSGLSRGNQVTAGLMTAWINTFHRDDDLRSIFVESLAVGGETGTLRKRFKGDEFDGVRIQAKSGFINGVSCLTGFVTTPDGRRRSFSVLINDLPVGAVGAAKTAQEQIVAAIAKDMLAREVLTIGG